MDTKPAIGIAEVPFHRLDGHEEGLRYLAIRKVLRRECRDPMLTGREGGEAAHGGPPRSDPQACQLDLRLPFEHPSPEPTGLFEAATKVIGRSCPSVLPSQRAAEFDQGPRMFKNRARPLQDCHCFLEQR